MQNKDEMVNVEFIAELEKAWENPIQITDTQMLKDIEKARMELSGSINLNETLIEIEDLQSKSKK